MNLPRKKYRINERSKTVKENIVQTPDEKRKFVFNQVVCKPQNTKYGLTLLYIYRRIFSYYGVYHIAPSKIEYISTPILLCIRHIQANWNYRPPVITEVPYQLLKIVPWYLVGWKCRSEINKRTASHCVELVGLKTEKKCCWLCCFWSLRRVPPRSIYHRVVEPARSGVIIEEELQQLTVNI